jgi:hypothetical protein
VILSARINPVDIGGQAFDGTSEDLIIRVPAESVEEYKRVGSTTVDIVVRRDDPRCVSTNTDVQVVWPQPTIRGDNGTPLPDNWLNACIIVNDSYDPAVPNTIFPFANPPHADPPIRMWQETVEQPSERAWNERTVLPFGSSDPHLHIINITSGAMATTIDYPLSPTFSATHFDYQTEVRNHVVGVHVDATARIQGTSIDGLGDNQPLQEGDNFFEVKALAEDIRHTLTYRVKVVRAAPVIDDATLVILSINRGNLRPNFSSNVTTYGATVSSDVTSISITAIAAAAAATIRINGEMVTHGTHPFLLNPGDNTFTIEVTAIDGIAKMTYTLTIERDRLTSADELVDISETQIYPNPVTDNLTIQNRNIQAGEIIRIYDTTGSLVATHVAQGEETVIPVGNLPEGIYILNIRNYTSLFIKQ